MRGYHCNKLIERKRMFHFEDCSQYKLKYITTIKCFIGLASDVLFSKRSASLSPYIELSETNLNSGR
jgi:hypothetical protein